MLCTLYFQVNNFHCLFQVLNDNTETSLVSTETVLSATYTFAFKKCVLCCMRFSSRVLSVLGRKARPVLGRKCNLFSAFRSLPYVDNMVKLLS